MSDVFCVPHGLMVDMCGCDEDDTRLANAAGDLHAALLALVPTGDDSWTAPTAAQRAAILAALAKAEGR